MFDCPNGCGKSNLTNSLVLIGRARKGNWRGHSGGGWHAQRLLGRRRARSLPAQETSKTVVLGFEAEEFGYELQVGLPSLNEHALGTMFTLDPRVKEEYIWPSEPNRRVLMLKRDEPSAWLRNAEAACYLSLPDLETRVRLVTDN